MNALENAGIGLMIVDEVHVGIGPETFSMSSLHINCKRTFGLSATPTRGDGNDDIIKYHLGIQLHDKSCLSHGRLPSSKPWTNLVKKLRQRLAEWIGNDIENCHLNRKKQAEYGPQSVLLKAYMDQ